MTMSVVGGKHLPRRPMPAGHRFDPTSPWHCSRASVHVPCSGPRRHAGIIYQLSVPGRAINKGSSALQNDEANGFGLLHDEIKIESKIALLEIACWFEFEQLGSCRSDVHGSEYPDPEAGEEAHGETFGVFAQEKSDEALLVLPRVANLLQGLDQSFPLAAADKGGSSSWCKLESGARGQGHICAGKLSVRMRNWRAKVGPAGVLGKRKGGTGGGDSLRTARNMHMTNALCGSTLQYLLPAHSLFPQCRPFPTQPIRRAKKKQTRKKVVRGLGFEPPVAAVYALCSTSKSYVGMQLPAVHRIRTWARIVSTR